MPPAHCGNAPSLRIAAQLREQTVRCHNALTIRARRVPSRSEILDQVATIAAETLDWRGELKEDSKLIDDLGLDSLRALSLVIEIENSLRIRLTPDDEAGLVTVGDLLTAIENHLGREA